MTDPTSDLKKLKNRGKLGKGLQAPPPQPKPLTPLKNEHEPAVTVAPKKQRRTFRIATYIHEEYGQRLQRLQLKYSLAEGRKPSIGEILERGLGKLEE